jgi:hypothetical protein
MDHINLLLVGPIGSGKSTTIETIVLGPNHHTNSFHDPSLHTLHTLPNTLPNLSLMPPLLLNGYLDDVSPDTLLSQLTAYCGRGTRVGIDDMDQVGAKGQLIVAHCMDRFPAVIWTFTATQYSHISAAIQVRCATQHLSKSDISKTPIFADLDILATVQQCPTREEAIQYGLSLLDQGYAIDDLLCRLEQEQDQLPQTNSVVPILLQLTCSRHEFADEIAVAHLMVLLFQHYSAV